LHYPQVSKPVSSTDISFNRQKIWQDQGASAQLATTKKWIAKLEK
jgi:hypothetical protein